MAEDAPDKTAAVNPALSGGRPRPPQSLWARLGLQLAVLAFAAGASCIVLYPVASQITRYTVNTGDAMSSSWILAWEAHALSTPGTSFYDGNIMYPSRLTLAYGDMMLANLPLAAPVFLLTHNAILTANVMLLATFIISLWSGFQLARHFTGSLWAGLVGGTVFAFNLYHLNKIGHLNVVSVQWLPLVFLYLDRTLRQQRWRDWAGLVIFFNVQFLCSYYIGLYMAVGVVAMALLYLLTRFARPTWRLGLLTAVGGLVIGLVNLPFARPYLELARMYQFSRPYQAMFMYSAHLTSFFSSRPEQWLWGNATAWFRASGAGNEEQMLFLGLVVLILAMLGATAAKRWPQYRVLITVQVLLFVIAAIFMAGPRWRSPWLGRIWLPYMALYKYVPGFKGLRACSRFMMIGIVPVSVLAALGANRLLGQVRWKPLAALLLCALVVAEAGVNATKGANLPVGAEIPPLYQWLAAQPEPLVILELPIEFSLDHKLDGMRMYYATYHWKTLINGFCSYGPPWYGDYITACASFPSPAAIRELRGVKADLVIVHDDEYRLLGLRSPTTAEVERSKVFVSLGTVGEARLFANSARGGLGALTPLPKPPQ